MLLAEQSSRYFGRVRKPRIVVRESDRDILNALCVSQLGLLEAGC